MVNTLREFLISFIELMKYETALNTLYEIMDHCTQDRETTIAQRVVNQVLHKKRNNKEFILRV
jgi:hypothetical protein